MIIKKKTSFSKLPRLTDVSEIMKKAEKLPAVGQYNTEIKEKSLGNFK